MKEPATPRRIASAALSLSLASTVVTTVVTTATLGPAGAAEVRHAAEGPTTHVRITRYHNVKMPSQLQPGMHRIVVRSSRPSGLQFVRADAGYTKREMSRDVAIMWEDVKALRRFERNVELLGGVNSRRGEPGIMWMRIPVGRYWVFDSYPDKFLPRKMFDLRVAGERLRGVLPGRATLRAVNEVDWAERPAAIPGAGLLILRNNSADNHFFGVSKLAKGKTMADFKAWVEDTMNGGDTEPPVNFDVGLDSGVVAPGRAMSLKYSLPPGRYVMTCWWPDAHLDAAPHAFMGMYRGLRVR